MMRPASCGRWPLAAFAPGATEEQARRSVDAMVAFNRPNAETHSGIWRDLAVRKRRTEVDVQVLPVAGAVRAGTGRRARCRAYRGCARMADVISELPLSPTS